MLIRANLADYLGDGSVQTSGEDDAFWNALNLHVKNLHAVISGHGARLLNFTSCTKR
jgi:hypothetical protein